jgi:hypothetical protein
MSRKSQRTTKSTEKALAIHHQQRTATTRSRQPKSKPNGKKRLASPAEDDSGTGQASLDKASTSKRKVDERERKRARRHSPPAASDVDEIVLATDDDESVEEHAVVVRDSGESAESEVCLVIRCICSLMISQEQSDDELKEQHHAPLPEVLGRKKKAEDILTIFSDKCTVKFSFPGSGKVEVLNGRWCNECK